MYRCNFVKSKDKISFKFILDRTHLICSPVGDEFCFRSDCKHIKYGCKHLKYGCKHLSMDINI